MGLLSRQATQAYANDLMSAPKTGKGPWREAIKYWLEKCDMTQAELARATGIAPKSISSMARGFHTTTQQLQKVATAFSARLPRPVKLQHVLVSPEWIERQGFQRHVIQEAVAAAIEAHDRAASNAMTYEQHIDRAVADIEEAAAKEDKKRKRPPGESGQFGSQGKRPRGKR